VKSTAMPLEEIVQRKENIKWVIRSLISKKDIMIKRKRTKGESYK
jgi:hypothetical protein